MKSRVVIVQQLSHQALNQKPVYIEGRSAKDLVSDEEPYQRRMKVTEDYKEVDQGWVKQASLIHIEHIKPHYSVNPNEEQLKADKARGIKVLLYGELLLCTIPPGEWLQIPCPDVEFSLSTTQGEAFCSLTLLPV